MPGRPLVFAIAILLTAVPAHAVNYLVHEYCHAIVAWLLGWKRDPFGLDYGTPTLANILFQQQIDENVDYAPIFAAHAGWAAACIAAAGPLLGNGGTALLCDAMIRRQSRRPPSIGRDRLLWVLVWMDGFATFNVWSYAPLRTLATHADMALLARGLGISVWLLMPFVTAIGGWLLWRFCRTALPLVQGRLYPGDARTVLGAALLGICFVFYSTSGLDGAYGPFSALLDLVSIFVLLPLALIGLARHSPPAA